MKTRVLEYIVKDGYELRREEVSVGNEKPVEMLSAYTPSGHYIGDDKQARFLIKERGIIPELAVPTNKVCSVGYCVNESRWYGWSHRAMVSFGIGDMIFEEAYGDETTPITKHGWERIESLAQARQAAVNFARMVA